MSRRLLATPLPASGRRQCIALFRGVGILVAHADANALHPAPIGIEDFEPYARWIEEGTGAPERQEQP